jgi:hypothetical protein
VTRLTSRTCFSKKSFDFMDYRRSIVSDRYMKFIGNFWRTLWKKLGTNLEFSSSVSSVDRWIDRGSKHKSGRLIEKLGDRAP